eukprot:TRINITY_DN11524_c0_g1_i1.p1 TRINITY_DN11524_c0_g1~~TRINITY_DN11524_c0_g1_i1.p1  ORF type:complete len:596 (+),score=136.21 TRINITY_DN11524_c0_g1_i1:61-1848(+)
MATHYETYLALGEEKIKVREMEVKIKVLEQKLRDEETLRKDVERQLMDELKRGRGDPEDLEDPNMGRTDKRKKGDEDTSMIAKQWKVPDRKGKIPKLIQKGRGCVDPDSGLADSTHVLEIGDSVYQCTLNQTNITSNNNKFYIIQVLERDIHTSAGPNFWAFSRWGRVGAPGSVQLQPCETSELAIQSFEKKFFDKTKNTWDSRFFFTKYEGKYDLLELQHESDDVVPSDCEDQDERLLAGCRLHTRLQKVLKHITSPKYMKNMVQELHFDTDTSPLGSLSRAQLIRGFRELQSAAVEIEKKSPSVTKIQTISSNFYTTIPHKFGFRRPPLLNNMELIREKAAMLDELYKLEVSHTLIKNACVAGVHPYDSTYEAMGVTINPLSIVSPEYSKIVNVMKETHGGTHSNFKLRVDDIFEVDHPNAAKHPSDSSKNRYMLWHGSRKTNWVGILSEGLRVAPPEAPPSGYMFGKGIYFADTVSKSAQYCFANCENSCGFLTLNEVCVGTPKKLKQAMYMESPQPGTHSTMGVGLFSPSSFSEDINGVKWPSGGLVEGKFTPGNEPDLLYNEYIVYNPAQVRTRYLIKVKFDFTFMGDMD